MPPVNFLQPLALESFCFRAVNIAKDKAIYFVMRKQLLVGQKLRKEKGQGHEKTVKKYADNSTNAVL